MNKPNGRSVLKTKLSLCVLKFKREWNVSILSKISNNLFSCLTFKVTITSGERVINTSN